MTELDNSELFNVEIAADPKPRSFSPDEMVTCDACLRANPPTRPNCLYCGERLSALDPVAPPPAADEVAPAEVVPAAPSFGFYVALTTGPGQQLEEPLLQQVATRADLKLSDLQSAVRASGRLPLIQASTSRQADEIIEEFRVLGIPASLIKDEDLKPSANKKIRALEFSDDGVAGFVGTPAERLFASWEDLSLLVTGRLQMNNVEDVVRRKRGGTKPVDRRELTNDETIFDLYNRSAEDGWRVFSDSFDFSCLGERKGITAFENFRALINLLRERAPNLEVDESYLAARPVLAKIWPMGANMRTGGWRRSGAGKYDISTVTTTDNENQFTNYSRLLRFFKMREL